MPENSKRARLALKKWEQSKLHSQPATSEKPPINNRKANLASALLEQDDGHTKDRYDSTESRGI